MNAYRLGRLSFNNKLLLLQILESIRVQYKIDVACIQFLDYLKSELHVAPLLAPTVGTVESLR